MLLTVTAVVRLGWMGILPARAFSVDLKDWRIVAASLLMGINPYVKYRVLNWPPFWMEVLYVLGKVSVALDWDFLTVARITLIIADMVLVAVTFNLMCLLTAGRSAIRILLFGFCLNPFLILLTIDHGNFDAFASIMIVAFLINLVRFGRRADQLDWLCASAFLGLGIFIKTFPLVLLPLLLGQCRGLTWKVRILGACLCFAPVTLAMAPLYVLDPREITEGVLAYRSVPGNSGLVAILELVGGESERLAYGRLFARGLPVILGILTVLILRFPFRRESQLVSAACVLLIGLFEWGLAIVLNIGFGRCLRYWFFMAWRAVLSVELLKGWRSWWCSPIQ